MILLRYILSKNQKNIIKNYLLKNGPIIMNYLNQYFPLWFIRKYFLEILYVLFIYSIYLFKPNNKNIEQ